MQSYNFISIEKNGVKTQFDITKDDLLKKYPSIKYRDLHIIDKNMSFRNSSIIVKDKIIVIKLHFIRCIIKPDSVLLIKLSENDSFYNNISLLENSLIVSAKDATQKNSFEFRVLETIFITIRDYFDDITVETLAPKTAEYYDALESSQLVKTVKNKGFSELYKYIVTVQSSVEDIRDMLTEISEWEDEELDEFYISRVKCNTIDSNNVSGVIYANANSDTTKHNKLIRELINNYKSHFEENMDDINKMIKLMDLVIKLTNIDLADTRNKMAEFDININIFMVATTLSGLIASTFGMNVPNHLESNNISFTIIWICIIILIIIIYFITRYGFRYKIKQK